MRTDEVADLGEVASQAVRQMRPQARAAATLIHIQLPTGTNVLGERFRICQVLVNLLSNAVKFSLGGTVDFTAHNGGRTVTLTVDDDGIGVGADGMETPFEPFTGHSVTVPGSGNGLGLVISRQLARAMGGDLRLESAGIGRGTRAALILQKA